MKINRIKKDKDFVVMHTHALRNKDLSLAAKGLHALIMQLPEDWELNVEGLVSLSKNGRDANASALKELELAGYVVKFKKREKGRFVGYEYNIYEVPQHSTNNGLTVNGKTVNGSTVNGKTATIKYEDINSSKEDIKVLNAEFENSATPSDLEPKKVEPKTPNNKEKEKSAAKKEKEVQQFVDVIKYFNLKSGRSFQITEQDLKGKTDKYKLVAKVLQLYTMQDIMAVIDDRVSEWGLDSKMSKYLQPATVFAAINFQKYIEGVRAGASKIGAQTNAPKIETAQLLSKAQKIGFTGTDLDLSKICARIAAKMPKEAPPNAVEGKVMLLLEMSKGIGYSDIGEIAKQYDSVIQKLKTQKQ